MLADWAQGEAAQRNVALGTGDEAAAGIVQLAPPGVIDIGLVEDVSGVVPAFVEICSAGIAG